MNENYRQFLMRLRSEVDRIVESKEESTREAAYRDAVPRVLMQDAEELDLSPFEARLLDKLDTLSPHQSSEPVPTKRVSTEMGMDYFAVYYHLRKLEERGLLSRPQGPRSGWKVA